MTTTAGLFNETTMLNVRRKLADMNWDDRVNLQYIPEIESMLTIFAEETTKITDLENPKKDKVVEVEWINACDIGVQDCTTCSFNGTLLSTNTQEYELDICKESEFAVYDEIARTNDFDHEEFIAKGFIKADKELSEWFNQRLLAEINTAKGVNVLAPGDNRGCVDGSDTYIAPPYWNATLINYIIRMYKRNRFGSPYLLTGSNLHEAWLDAQFKAGNAEGKGDVAKFKALQIFFDEVNFAATGFDLFSFLINRGTIAIANKARYDGFSAGSPWKSFAEHRWSQKSEFSKLKYDIHYTNACVSDTGGYLHSWKMILRGGIFFNPTGCNDTNTGILSLRCGNCP